MGRKERTSTSRSFILSLSPIYLINLSREAVSIIQGDLKCGSKTLTIGSWFIVLLLFHMKVSLDGSLAVLNMVLGRLFTSNPGSS
jgi:hypothetical protein